jgi:hypothetical protein
MHAGLWVRNSKRIGPFERPIGKREAIMSKIF